MSAEIFFHTKHSWAFGFDAHSTLQEVYLTAELNENAVINHVHVLGGGERIAAFDVPDGRGLDIRGPNVFQTFNVPDRRVSFGVAVCVRVDFPTGEPMGEVNLTGAGVGLYKD